MVPWLAKGETTEAYGRLLKVRPDVDPLPPYRRGLCTLEAELYGASQLQILQILAKGGPENRKSDHVSKEPCTVSDGDYFARHITELRPGYISFRCF